MSHPVDPSPCLYFVAITTSLPELWEKVINELKKELGKVLLYSETYNFSEFTSYYEKEMGKNLLKKFYFFEKLRNPDFLINLKHICYEIEKEFSKEGKRKVNVDPGYITLSKLVLATFKDFSHRIYLGQNVFAEVTLIYQHKNFVELPWTYRDYKQKEVIEIFKKAREILKEKLRCLKQSSNI
jgi:hypothetical protein